MRIDFCIIHPWEGHITLPISSGHLILVLEAICMLLFSNARLHQTSLSALFNCLVLFTNLYFPPINTSEWRWPNARCWCFVSCSFYSSSELNTYSNQHLPCDQPKNWGGGNKLGGAKMFDYRRITLFDWAIASQSTKWLYVLKIFLGEWPSRPPWLRLCLWCVVHSFPL